MTDKIELLPCPFCSQNHQDTHAYIPDHATLWEVICGNCCAVGQPSATEELAIKRWNTRASVSARVPEWLPIESAPRDGTWIFGYWPTMSISQYPRVIFADDCSEHDIWYMPNNLEFGCVYPTHWMPLPAAPTPQD